MGALNQSRFRLQDLTLPKAGKATGKPVSRYTATFDPCDSSHGPGRNCRNLDRGYGFFSLCMDDTPFLYQPRGAWKNLSGHIEKQSSSRSRAPTAGGKQQAATGQVSKNKMSNSKFPLVCFFKLVLHNAGSPAWCFSMPAAPAQRSLRPSSSCCNRCLTEPPRAMTLQYAEARKGLRRTAGLHETTIN